ncbi:MAG TPA: IPT/TIG domain-containing protein [Thermoanaerobaculia bacterium]|nr:IPT/TIG domain-containing protein [Thermoanaerobaculia bacterium]
MDPRRLHLAAIALLALLILPSGVLEGANLASVTVNPTRIVAGSPLELTFTLDAPAPPENAEVAFSAAPAGIVDVPAQWGVFGGATSRGILLQTRSVDSTTDVTITATYAGVTKTAVVTVSPRLPVRGAAGDLWADVILGKSDFGEITPNQVSANRVFNPGGVLVDRSVRPNRVYVYDAGNSRVLGLSHLGTCAGGTKGGQNCTTNSDCPDSSCAIQEGRAADLVLGQPSFTRSACNGDGAFQRYPTRATPSASTLCLLPEDAKSVLEAQMKANMAVDGSGNLYVPDLANSRVLRYDSPFTSGPGGVPDAVADYVWGQPDFTTQDCNGGRGVGSPDRESLCLYPGWDWLDGGVGVDPGGNLWVADYRNNRVVRFPKNTLTGIPEKTADLVLGQPDFSSWAPGPALNQMSGPDAVRVDASGAVYVADSVNHRVLIFDPPVSTGMAGRALNFDFGHANDAGGGPDGLELDPVTGGLWVNDPLNTQILLFVGGVVQRVLLKDEPTNMGGCPCRLVPDPASPGNYICSPILGGDGPDFTYADGNVGASWRLCVIGGSIGVDSDGNVLAAGLEQQDVWRFPRSPWTPSPGIYHSADARLFPQYQPATPNEIGPAGFYDARGVAVGGNQLIVADRTRLMFWNDPPNLTSGQAADGLVAHTDPRVQGGPLFGTLRVDGASRLWTARNEQIVVYSLPLKGGDAPIATFGPPLPVLGGGTVSWDEGAAYGAVEPAGAGNRVWFSDPHGNRVFRVRDPLTNPVVDIILGQTSAAGTECNQGRGPQGPDATSLCNPGGLALDRQGNLYLADNAAEASGNFRMLEFDAGLFPDSPATALFAVPASRVFGTGGSFTIPGCVPEEVCGAVFQPALKSDGQLVVGGNDYLNPRFPYVYTNPLVSQRVSGFLNDFTSWPGAATFDPGGNLYVTDGVRDRVLIYLNPLGTAPTPPAVTGISPDSGSTAGGTSVTITGTGFQSGATVTLGGVAATGVVVTPPDRITATTGAHVAGPVDVVVTNLDGRSGTLTGGFLYVVPPPAPTIRSFTPMSGIAGASVTISGTSFTGATSVAFNGASASFVVSSAVSITATVPPTATTGRITVTTTGGTATSLRNFTVKPSITGFSPGSGAVGIGVTITGSGFGGATAVRFNGTTAAFTVDAGTRITASVPAGATTGKITVTTPAGTATSATSFVVAPRITSFTPTSGLTGASVTIYGANFTGATAVTFNGASAGYVATTTTLITVTVHSAPTAWQIAVTTPAGTATSTGSFSIKPSISGFAPAGGAVGIGVTITGVAFDGATVVKFNGATAVFTVDASTRITATVPAGATTGKLTVTTPVGTATSAASFVVAPRITSFTPTSGVRGASVAIYGANFTGATAVTFNGTPASYVVNSATRITATVPSGATTGPIGVTTSAGTGTSPASFTVK